MAGNGKEMATETARREAQLDGTDQKPLEAWDELCLILGDAA